MGINSHFPKENIQMTSKHNGEKHNFNSKQGNANKNNKIQIYNFYFSKILLNTLVKI